MQDDSAANAATVPTAKVVAVQRGDISRVLTLAGQFQPYQVVDVHPKVSGYMARINVDIGDVVHKGETLAVLEVPELKAQLQQTVFEMQGSNEEIVRAQHEINSAEATHAALHAQSDRLKQASEAQPGLIAQQELDDVLAKDLSSEAQVDAAKAAMAVAKEHANGAQADNQRVQALHDYTSVTAPLEGVVIWRYADTGALIQGGTNSNSQALPIVRLSQSDLLRLRFPVPEDDVKYVHVGDSLQVRVDAIRPLLHWKDRALHARRQLRDADDGNRSRCREQGPVDLARDVCEHSAATGARKRRSDGSGRFTGSESRPANGLCPRWVEPCPHSFRRSWIGWIEAGRDQERAESR